MLPNFKSKILTQLLDTQMDNGPTLFNLMGQCFQEVGLTKCTSVLAKRCPTEADSTKANFNKCIRDYFEAVAEDPNVVELFCDLVFLVSIGWYFLGILPTNTKEKFGWYILVL
jgi:hypothetical protein